MTTLPHDDELLAALLAQRQPRKKGCVSSAIEVACTIAVVALAVCGGYFLLEIWLGAPAAPAAPNTVQDRNYPTPAALPPQPRQQQPVYQPAAPLPDCSEVTDTTTACVQGQGGNISPNIDPTPTAAPTPTQEGFWSAEDIAAFTATAEAFYNPDLIPTAPPAFVQAIKDGCADPTKVAQSPLLASWCGPDD